MTGVGPGSASPADDAPPAPGLSPAEGRVLGCLVEKAAATPDQYPLTLRALVAACNQRTNRDPVVAYDDDTVEAALDGLRRQGLARRLKAHGSRAVKHRHVLGEALGVDDSAEALLALLLLRGAQTPGELRTRAERLHRFTDPAAVEAALEALAARAPALVVRRPRAPGQKEHRWAELLTGADAIADAAVAAGGERPSAPAAPGAALTDAAVGQVGPGRRAFPATLEIRAPGTGAVLRTVDVDDDAGVAAKVRRARAAGPAWWALGFDARAATVVEFCERLAADAEGAARLLARETGKPIRSARAEIEAVPERIEWFLARTPEVLAPTTVTAGADREERVTVEPRGVVAHVSAWNYPWFVALNSLVPALLCGNTVVYKPSEHATLTGRLLAGTFHDSGVPADVLQVAVGPGATGAALVQAEVDHVSFTGSRRTGLAVARAAADQLVPVTLELGGKDAAYVCDDVDLAAVVTATVSGAFYNAGQSCCAIERLYVHDAVHDEFVDAFVDAVEALRVGDPDDDATDIGPLTRPDQVELVHRHVTDAVAKGARVLTGGDEPRPGWYAPTVLVDVDHSMAVMREETFGPVIGVQRVADDDDARQRMDDSEYGLTASVFTPDRARAERILGSLDVGSAYWNTADRTTSRLPWSGRRGSGLGTSLGLSGIRALVRERAWHLFATP